MENWIKDYTDHDLIKAAGAVGARLGRINRRITIAGWQGKQVSAELLQRQSDHREHLAILDRECDRRGI